MEGSSLSTNTVDDRRDGQRRYTVAELVARERTTVQAFRPVYSPTDTATRLSVAELLRREGIEFSGEDSPTVELDSVPVHVNELLRRQTAAPATAEASLEAPAEDADKPRSKRVAAVAGVAALAGLTLAGLIAIKPQVAFTPGGESAAPPGDDNGVSSSTATAAGGGSQPTTLKREPVNTAAESNPQASAPQSDAPAGQAREGGGSTTPVSETTSPVPTSSTATSTPPSEDAPPPKETKPAPPKEDDGGPGNGDGGLLDPVLNPVLDGVVDPLTGAITGTLFP